MAKAEEICAPFTDNCPVTIHLLKNGNDNHYLLKAAWSYYQPTKSAKETQNLNLSIEPYYCTTGTTQCYIKALGEKPTIYNKRRDKFSINVGKGLSLVDITFDSLDSILDQDSDACMGKAENCCSVNSANAIT